MLENAIYEDIVIVPLDASNITWTIAFIHQDCEKLSEAGKKLIGYIRENVKVEKIDRIY